MIERKDVEKLATLARIKMTPNEADEFKKELDPILAYVEQVREAVVSRNFEGQSFGTAAVDNVLREDGEPHESGIYTDDILTLAPHTEKGYIKVKKILSND